MDNKIVRILKQFKEELTSQFGAEIVSVIVYGSYARSEENENSDLDILIIVKDKELEKQIDNIAYEIMWNSDFIPLLSTHVVTEEHFNYIKKIRTGFYESIEEEGIEV
jgi:Predicted nucleotidyltransferases